MVRPSAFAVFKLTVVLGKSDQYANAPNTVAFLRARGERPCGGRADHRDDLSPSHSITSSA